MHSFEVHSNESACRKKVRLGLEQVLCWLIVSLLQMASNWLVLDLNLTSTELGVNGLSGGCSLELEPSVALLWFLLETRIQPSASGLGLHLGLGAGKSIASNSARDIEATVLTVSVAAGLEGGL